MTRLSVNLNKVALLRNARTIGIPSVIRAAEICVAAGAHGITVHPRPDQRHIRFTDVYELAEIGIAQNCARIFEDITIVSLQQFNKCQLENIFKVMSNFKT